MEAASKSSVLSRRDGPDAAVWRFKVFSRIPFVEFKLRSGICIESNFRPCMCAEVIVFFKNSPHYSEKLFLESRYLGSANSIEKGWTLVVT